MEATGDQEAAKWKVTRATDAGGQRACDREQVRRVGDRGRTRKKTISSDAVLPLPEVCATALRAQLMRQEAMAEAAGQAWHPMGLVVTSRYGSRLEPRNFHRYFNARATAAGMPVIPVHSTRRTCASLLVAISGR